MPGIRRRTLLKTAGGGLAAILASGRAPAFAQGTTVHWLRLGDFVPASDVLWQKELLPEDAVKWAHDELVKVYAA